MKLLLLLLIPLFQPIQPPEGFVYVSLNVIDHHKQKASADIEFYHQNQLILKTKTKNGTCYFQVKKGNYTLVITRCKKDTINYIADRTKETYVAINTECEI